MVCRSCHTSILVKCFTMTLCTLRIAQLLLTERIVTLWRKPHPNPSCLNNLNSLHSLHNLHNLYNLLSSSSLLNSLNLSNLLYPITRLLNRHLNQASSLHCVTKRQSGRSTSGAILQKTSAPCVLC